MQVAAVSISDPKLQKMPVPKPVAGFQSETLDGETILLHPTRNIIIYSNPTAALIWQLCDGIRTTNEIVELLSAAYPEAQDQIRTDVLETIQTLVEQGALKSE
jgi:hypothetical protein